MLSRPIFLISHPSAIRPSPIFRRVQTLCSHGTKAAREPGDLGLRKYNSCTLRQTRSPGPSANYGTGSVGCCLESRIARRCLAG